MQKTTKIVLISLAVSLLLIVVALVLVYLLVFFKEADEGCEIYPFHTNLHPLIVLAGTTSFLYPAWGSDTLKFQPDQRVDFICPGRSLVLENARQNTGLLTGTCESGTRFRIGSSSVVEWSSLSCNDTLWRDIRATGRTCSSDGQELETGFYVGDGRWITSLSICFDPKRQTAYYTFINQTASINRRVLTNARPSSFLQGSGIYSLGTSVSNLFLRTNQRATINQLVGLPSNSTKYIRSDSNHFLARGHLTARSDGFYGAQQNATFYMQNVAPQWQTFNGYNWNQIEIDVRDYASENGVDLQVWTGTYGVTTLPHETTGEPVELYLFVNGTTRAVPVPEFFWKVAYNPLTERGVALIGLNNPYNGTFSKVCFDVADRLSWLHCKRNDQEYGFCYACSITTLRYVVDYVPQLIDRGLLL